MAEKFAYVTYIRTTPEKLWHALTDAEFNAKYWFGAHQESTWKEGADWRIAYPDGRVMDTGKVLEIETNRRIVLHWRNQFMPELKAEGFSRCTITLEPQDGGVVKLTVVHEIDRDQSKFIQAVGGGWPKILSSLKSLLETGEALEKKPA